MLKNTSTNLISIILERGFIAFTGIFLSILFARTLGPSGLGDWKLLMSIQVAFLYLSTFGLGIMIFRYAAEFSANSRSKALWELLKKTFPYFSISLSLIFILLIWMYFFDKPSNSLIFTKENSFLVAFFLFTSILSDVYFRPLITGLGWRSVVAIVQILNRLIIIIIVTSLVYDDKLNLIQAILVFSLANLLEIMLYFLFLQKKWWPRTKKELKNVLDLSDLTKVKNFASNQWYFRIVQFFKEQAADGLLIVYLLNIISLGIYSAAAAIPVFLSSLSPGKLFFGFIVPKLVTGNKSTEKEKSLRIYMIFRILQKSNIIFIWPLIAILTFSGSDILHLMFGEEFSSSLITFQLLMISVIISTFADPYFLIAISLEKSALIFQVSLWLLLKFVMSLILIPYLGINGIAISSIVISILTFLHYFLKLRVGGKRLFFPLKEALKVSSFICLILLVLTALNILFSNFESLYLLVLSAFLFLFSYLIFIRNVKLFTPNEFFLLKKNIGKYIRIFFKEA